MRKLTLAFAAAAIMAATPSAAHAATLTVTGGKLEWTMPNYFASGDNNRSWLGYITTSGVGQQFSNGNATVTAPATLTGPTGPVEIVDGTADRGTDQLYTFTLPVTPGGTYNENGVGDIQLGGTITWTTHGSGITTVNPILKLNGLAGTFHSSGVNVSGAAYDTSTSQFGLDLSTATVTQRADGSREITGITTIGTAPTVFQSTPTDPTKGALTFLGAMKLTLKLAYPEPGTGPAGEKGDTGDAGATVFGSAGAQGPQGLTGPQGPVGPKGARGPAGKSAKISTFTLKKAPFAGTAKRSVKLVARKTGKLVATGTLKGRKLRLSHLATTKLKGSYVLRVANGKRRATVTLK